MNEEPKALVRVTKLIDYTANVFIEDPVNPGKGKESLVVKATKNYIHLRHGERSGISDIAVISVGEARLFIDALYEAIDAVERNQKDHNIYE